MRHTLEEQRQYQRLVQLGVEISTQTPITAVTRSELATCHIWSGAESSLACDSLVFVTQRISRTGLYDELKHAGARLDDAAIGGVYLVGDAWQPGMMPQAMFSEHRLAREIDSANPAVPLPFIGERRLVGATEDDYTLHAAAIR